MTTSKHSPDQLTLMQRTSQGMLDAAVFARTCTPTLTHHNAMLLSIIENCEGTVDLHRLSMSGTEPCYNKNWPSQRWHLHIRMSRRDVASTSHQRVTYDAQPTRLRALHAFIHITYMWVMHLLLDCPTMVGNLRARNSHQTLPDLIIHKVPNLT